MRSSLWVVIVVEALLTEFLIGYSVSFRLFFNSLANSSIPLKAGQG